MHVHVLPPLRSRWRVRTILLRGSTRLQSLRLALQSRHEALSTHTLAACAVLYLLEVSLEVLIRI